MKKTDKSTQLFNLSFFSKSKTELLSILEGEIENSSKVSYIFTPNPEQIVQATQDKAFKAILEQGTYLLPDGVGLLIASQLLQAKTQQPPLEERITGVEVLQDLLQLAALQKLPVLLIGGQGYAETQSGELTQLQVSIQGIPSSIFWTPGYENITSPTSEEEKAVERHLTEVRPALVFVAFGAPYQEEWIIEHAALLQASKVKIAMVIGGGMDYVTGKFSRAPQVWQQLGLEWFYRLITQPWRWRRQLRLVSFVGLTIKELFA